MLQLTRSHQLILLLTVRICMFDSTNSDVRSYGLPLEYETLPEMLKARGYATHMQGKWHVGYRLERKTPTFRGFDSFIGFMHSGAPSCLCPSGLFRLRHYCHHPPSLPKRLRLPLASTTVPLPRCADARYDTHVFDMREGKYGYVCPWRAIDLTVSDSPGQPPRPAQGDDCLAEWSEDPSTSHDCQARLERMPGDRLLPRATGRGAIVPFTQCACATGRDSLQRPRLPYSAQCAAGRVLLSHLLPPRAAQDPCPSSGVAFVPVRRLPGRSRADAWRPVAGSRDHD